MQPQPGRLLCSNNVLNRFNSPHISTGFDNYRTCVFEQFQSWLFSDLSGPFKIWHMFLIGFLN